MLKTLPINEALNLVSDNPELFAAIQDMMYEGSNEVTLELDDQNGAVLDISKDSPTSAGVHVDSTNWSRKPRVATFSSVSKAIDEEERYTFSPWYVPDSIDAHGEWTDKKEVQKAFWKYLSNDDRDIRLQHNTDIVAGQWVEGATWPFEVTVPVKHPEGSTEYTFPAGTPFLGIKWEPWAWQMIKAGEIRGLSIGGTAARAAIDFQKDDYDPTGRVDFAKMIRQEDGKYHLYSHDGKRHLGEFDTQEQAQAREAEINRIKHMDKSFIPSREFMDIVYLAKHTLDVYEPTKEGLAAELADLLGETVAFKFMAHGFHWNVTGINFQQYHDLFQEIYEDADDAIDPLAENIRKLNFDAPFRLTDFLGGLAGMEVPDTNDPFTMCQILYVANETVRSCIARGFCMADNLEQQGIANFLADRQDMHSKWQWQLRSIVGEDFANAYEVDVHAIAHEVSSNIYKVREIEKHLNGRHDQSSHAGGAKGLPRVVDTPAQANRDAQAVKLAIGLHEKANALDARLTGTMTALSKKTGGELVGLEYRIKSTDSLARKIEADAKESHSGDMNKAAANISDASRYTMVYNNDNYTQGVDTVVKTLQQQGYEVRAKNFWQKGDDYQGVNIKMRAANGHVIELQLHTQDSLKIKETKLHPVYEKFREETNPVQKAALWATMVAIADSIPTPANYDQLQSIGELVRHTFGS